MHVNTRAPSSPSMGPSSLESVSDSEDWLEIAESESDFNSSLSEGHTSRSRRSSLSLPSSSGDHLEAWEGFTEGEDASPDNTHAFVADGRETTPGAEETPSDAEVKAALDQSLIGTLNASRSGSYGQGSTAQNSHGDLRLSFPDPLTSSLTGRDLIHHGTIRSKPKRPLSASDSRFSTPSSSSGSAVLVQAPLEASSGESSPSQEQHVSAPLPEQDGADKPDVILEIFLYGSSSPVRWSAVGTLIRKADYTGGRGVISVSHSPESYTRHYHVESGAGVVHAIAVYDRTGTSIEDIPPRSSTCPSLAFVCLPLPGPISMPDHTFYFPMIVTLDEESPMNHEALVAEWQSLGVPSSKQLALEHGIMTDEELVQLSSSEVETAMRPLLEYTLPTEHQETPVKPVNDKVDAETNNQLKGIISLSLAFMLAACILSTFLGSQTTPTRTSEANRSVAWDGIRPILNNTPSKEVVLETSLIPSSFKDYALAVIQPAVSPSARQSRREVLPLHKSLSPRSEPQVPKTSSEVMVRPQTSISTSSKSDTRPTTSRTASISASFIAPAETKALSLRPVTDSLSMIYNLAMKEIVEPWSDDYQDLKDACDGLLSAISDVILRRPKGVVETVSEEVQYRHTRAKTRAKEIVSFSLSEWNKRNNRAKSRAKSIRAETTKWISSTLDQWSLLQSKERD